MGGIGWVGVGQSEIGLCLMDTILENGGIRKEKVVWRFSIKTRIATQIGTAIIVAVVAVHDTAVTRHESTLMMLLLLLLLLLILKLEMVDVF